VRRRWIQHTLLTTTPPKGTALFLARIITAHPFLFDDYHGKRTTAEFLGAHPREVVDALPANAGDNRGLMILLGMVLGECGGRARPAGPQRQQSRSSRGAPHRVARPTARGGSDARCRRA
jgi:hypothetical protein